MIVVLQQPIVGYEGLYDVFSTGSVFSWPRRRSRGGLLRQGLSEGYPMVSLCKQGRHKSYKVHQLVLEAFDGLCPPGQECRHLDGNRLNNLWPLNLEWGTPSENGFDRTEHGTNPSSKITDDQVAGAFQLWERGSLVSLIAVSLGVTDTALRNRMKQLDLAWYKRLAVGNKKLSDSAALWLYERWQAGESKSSLAREAGMDHKALHYRFMNIPQEEIKP